MNNMANLQEYTTDSEDDSDDETLKESNMDNVTNKLKY